MKQLETTSHIVHFILMLCTGVWLRGDNKLVIEVIEERFLSEQENKK